MRIIDDSFDLACKELGEFISDGKLGSYEKAKTFAKLIGAIKDIMCIYDMENDGGMSSNNSYNSRSYAMYDDGRSYRGRARDSMGRFVSRSDGYSYRGNSYHGDPNEEFIDNLRSIADNAPNEHTRQSVMKLIQQMDR